MENSIKNQLEESRKDGTLKETLQGMGFNRLQSVEIAKGLNNEVDITKYADKKYDAAQMKSIRLALEEGMDITPFADNRYNYMQMEEIKAVIREHMDLDAVCNPAYDYSVMKEIRLSERLFYQQIKDIYATSVDYDPSDEMTFAFYKEVQNKLLWAVSGKTAAELVYYRANASLPQMGLTSTSLPNKVSKTDVEIGKNYLTEEEIGLLKLIVEQFLAYAETQAMQHKVMYMRDWIEKLKQVLTMNDKNILEHAGSISHKLAMQKAADEYDKYKVAQKQLEHLESIKELEQDIQKLRENKK